MRTCAVVLASLALAGATACTTGARSRNRDRRGDASEPSPAPLARAPREGTIPGTPSIRIVWEALAVETAQFESPNPDGPRGRMRFRTGGQASPSFGVAPELEAVLINASFVPNAAQEAEKRAKPAVGRVARITDQEMNDLLEALRRMEFFRYARPTSTVTGLFGSDRARGRVTVEQGGESVTLLSMRGLGLMDDTKEIPPIYAQAKWAVQMLKNRTPTLRVRAAGTVPLKPRPKAEGGKSSGGGG